MPNGPVVLSWRHIKLKIGGYTFKSLANDDQPVVFPNIEMVDVVYGKGGELYGNETGMLGGDVTVKVLPASPDAQTLLTWLAQRQKGSRRTFEGSFGDSVLNFSVELRGGIFKSCTMATSPGAAFEAVFAFQEIIPDYDGANFNNGGPVQATDDTIGATAGNVFDTVFGSTSSAAGDVFEGIFGNDGFGDS